MVHSKSVTPRALGAHQRRTRSALVMASKTVWGRARNTRRMTSSRSETRSACVWNGSRSSLAVMEGLLFFGFRFELDDEVVERGESRVPNLSIEIEPVMERPERLRAKPVESLAGTRLDT